MRARLNFTDFEGKPVTVELSSDLPITLGRSRDNSVMLRDEHASRTHARIHCENDVWHVRDFGLNGTRVNGEKIEQEAILRHGDEVRIGDTRMRFSILDNSPGGSTTKRIVINAEPPPTRLQYDDMTVLSDFMTASVRETEIPALMHKALEVILHQTSAYLVGFLSDDANDPLMKMVVPDSAKVDIGLSKQLNRRVLKEGKTVWLCCDVAETRTPESLAQFSDALCIPIRSATGRSHGTLHVYRMNAYFAERDLKFCEALAGYLANGLQLLRSRQALEAENSRLKGRLPTGEVMVGDSAVMRELRETIERVAPKSTTVLVRGETGVGKELVALAIHRLSNRAHGPLVTVNCAAVPGSLLEAELFGYRKGAFSGADRDHPGYFLQADEGTIFLDEVGEMTPECQARLLRVLDGRSFRQVGATADSHVNVRVVAATNRNLEDEVKKGKFREDLYYRLKGVTITVPPLRDHVDDIQMLVQYFLDKLGAEHRRQYRLTEPALTRLTTYAWPGNVRQLRSTLECAAIMAKTETIDESDFPSEPGHDDRVLPLNLGELERWAVVEALKRSNGNKTKAASMLGINRETLYAKIEKYGIERLPEDAVA